LEGEGGERREEIGRRHKKGVTNPEKPLFYGKTKKLHLPKFQTPNTVETSEKLTA
jgi:hypothetical protein